MVEFILRACVMFLTGFVTDVTWALYIKYVGGGNKLKGAFYSVGTGICTVVFVEGTIVSIWLTPFWLIGLFLGTYYSNEVEECIQKFYKTKRNLL